MKRLLKRPAIKTFSNLSPYLQINLILALGCVLVIAYSIAFSPAEDQYPVPCTHELLTGQACPTCGLSHSFSSMARLHLQEAREFSLFGPRLFLFILLQLILRLIFSLIYSKSGFRKNRLMYLDLGISLLAFSWAFFPLVKFLAYLINLRIQGL